jgi:hypothetical protein
LEGQRPFVLRWETMLIKPRLSQKRIYRFTIPYPLRRSSQSLEKVAGAFLRNWLRKDRRVLSPGFSNQFTQI